MIKISTYEGAIRSIEYIRELGRLDCMNLKGGEFAGYTLFFPQRFIGMTDNVVRQFASMAT
jgi:hypothetical protein